ncbi:NUDIX hydrolase [Patescibacteria group bacterium]|nr:NUDIX hydrolase [Patescibacteria group bacterium]
MNIPIKVKNKEGETLKAGCMIVDKGKVLLVTGKKGKTWSFPKGHVETGETLEQTAIREVQEETGYEVEITKRLMDLTYKNKKTGEPIRVAMFKAKPITDKGNKEPDIQTRWFSIEEAKKELSTHKPSSLLEDLDK